MKATILEALVTKHGVTFKEVEEALGVTRWLWDQAHIGIQEFASGKKQKATQGNTWCENECEARDSENICRFFV